MDSALFPVLDALLTNQGLQKISDTAAEALGNPFWIVDMNSNYMVQVSGDTHNVQLLSESQHGYVLEDTMLFVNQNRVREKTNSADSSYSFQAYGSEHLIITCPIRIYDSIVAYISVIDEHRPFTEDDYSKMNQIAQVVSTELQKDSFYRNNKEMQYSYFLSDLLENHIRHQDVKKRLETIGYHTREYFYLLTIELENIDSRRIVLHTIQEQVKFILVDCIYCLYQNHSVFLFTTEKDLTPQSSLFSKLKRFFKESNLKAAISDRFRNIILVPRNYDKTLASLRLGKQSMPEEFLYQYSALASWHMIDISKGLVSYSDFCNGAIEKLHAYDTKYHAELTLTLYRYLEQNCRVAQAAEVMGLHSNTLRQRLEKIKGLTGCELENGHQVFDLMMGLKIYFNEQKRDGRNLLQDG